MKTVIAICFFALLALTSASSATREHRSSNKQLLVSIRTGKSLYRINEKLSIQIQLENVGKGPLLLWRSWAWGVGRTDVRVIDNWGKDVMTSFLADQLPPPPSAENFIELQPREFFGIRLTEEVRHFVNAPGVYDILVDYTAPLSAQDIRKDVRLPDLPLWGRECGTISSNKVRIQISR